MLSSNIKRIIVREIPSIITIDNHNFNIHKTVGTTPISELSLPTVNISFLGEGNLLYKSFDDELTQQNNIVSATHHNTSTIRIKVAAKNEILTNSQTFIYNVSNSFYPLTYTPVQNCSIIGYQKDLNYRLINSDTIEWLRDEPNHNTTFTVNYEWIDFGYYLSSQIMEYIVKDFNGRISRIINSYGIDIIDFRGIDDISDIYTNDALSVLVYDITIAYPFTWQTINEIIDVDSVTIDVHKDNIEIIELQCNIN